MSGSGSLLAILKSTADLVLARLTRLAAQTRSTRLTLAMQTRVRHLTLSGGTLNASSINTGTGNSTFNFDGGTLNLMAGKASSIKVNNFNIGNAKGSNNNFTLSNGQTVTAYTQIAVGGDGTGTYTQNGGTTTLSGAALFLGYNSGSLGTYDLNGNSNLVATAEYIGYGGTGVFNQNGGTNTVSTLTLGHSSNSGTYNSNSGTLNVDVITDNSSNSYFNIDGGSLANLYRLPGIASSIVVNDFNIGNAAGTIGSFMTSNQILNTTSEAIGNNGIGTLTQNGGANTTSNLYIGKQSGSTGTYNLNGSSFMSAYTETVGASGSGDTLTKTAVPMLLASAARCTFR